VNHILSWILYGELIPSPSFFVTATTQVSFLNFENPEDIWSRFVLSNDLIPDCISISLANKILFCGKVKRILKQTSKNLSSDLSFMSLLVEQNQDESMNFLYNDETSSLEAFVDKKRHELNELLMLMMMEHKFNVQIKVTSVDWYLFDR
jgi:hypothetical protein